MDNQQSSEGGTRESAESGGGSDRSSVAGTAKAYARGAAGGLIFGLPLLMTMEMWWEGFLMSPARMILFMLFNFGILLVLERYSGFRDTFYLFEEVQDAVVAMGIGLITSGTVLFVLGVVNSGMPLEEIAGKIILESFPVSIGVSVAVSQLGAQDKQQQRRKKKAGFWGRKAIGVAGAMFFGLNVAVTEEPLMIAMRTDWHHLLLILILSFALSFAIVYAVDFQGSASRGDAPWWKIVAKDGTVSYAVALSVATYLLWTFGRFDPDTGLAAMVAMTVTLGFVTSLGSSAANLIL